MKRQQIPAEEAHENDRIWDLIDQASSQQPSGRFVDDTVRAARLAGQDHAWNLKSWGVGSLAVGLLGATAALVISLLPHSSPSPTSGSSALAQSAQAQEIQEIAETETLIAAVDHMEEFSDTELVALIGF